MGIIISGVGNAVPKRIVTNEDLEKIMDTSDEWITSRTGIKRRRIAEDETTYDLALEASKMALENSNLKPEDIDAVIVATSTPDYIFPTVANLLVGGLGLGKVMSFDLSAACSGTLYAIDVAKSMINGSSRKNILVVGAEIFSRLLNWEDRNTAVIFGDGAGAMILSYTEEDRLFECISKSDSDTEMNLRVKARENNDPFNKTDRVFDSVYMNGQEIYKFAVKNVKIEISEILENNKLAMSDIKLVITHQANERIIKSVEKSFGADGKGKFYVSLTEYGNTSAASVGLALADALSKGLISRGDKIILMGFGAGLTWSTALLEY